MKASVSSVLVPALATSRRASRFLRIALTVASLALSTQGRAIAHERPLSTIEMIQLSKSIIVAKVLSANVRWNSQHTLLVTDYRLGTERELQGSSLKDFVVTIPGGALNGEVHSTCVSLALTPGARYLFFLQDLARPSFVPITGGRQGLFREIPNIDGRPLVAAGDSAEPMRLGKSAIPFRAFVGAIEGLIAEVARHPPTTAALAIGFSQALPAKRYSPSVGIEGVGTYAAPISPSPVTFPLTPRPRPGQLTDAAVFAIVRGTPNAENDSGATSRSRTPPPIVFNSFLPTTPFYPHDQYQMAVWNRYADDLFWVYTRPSATWAFGNGIFDLAGFPDNEQVLNQFGMTWDPNLLGFTIFRFGSQGQIIEADIALNPQVHWSLDDDLSTRGNGPYSFEQTMLHELGHAWGFRHPWETQQVWWDSVLNYSPHQYRLPRLQAFDTKAVRAAYPGTKIRDAAISAYSTQGSPSSSHADYLPIRPEPNRIEQGAGFTVVNPISIEVTGSFTIAKAVVDVYLTPKRYSFANAIFIGSRRYGGPMRSGRSYLVKLGSLTVPTSTPAGTYYLSFVLRTNGDAVSSNDSAWSNSDQTLTVGER